MLDDDRRAPQELLETHRRTLLHLLDQQAKFGAGYVPAHVAAGIAEARAAIAGLKAQLRAAGATVDDQPQEDAPTASPATSPAPAEPPRTQIDARVQVDDMSGGAASALNVQQFSAQEVHIHAGAPSLTQPAPASVTPLRLPLDTVPAVAPLPNGSRMPFAPNPLFVGRDEELLTLARTLLSGTTTVIAAATGLGGLGKTQLATEFVHRYGQFYSGGVFWLNFTDATAVQGEVTACGGVGAMNLPSFQDLDPADQVARVRREWQQAVPRLLIFDNCENEQLLADWRPTSGGCQVLLTARRGAWDVSLGVRTLSLGVLPRASSIELLLKFRPELAADDPDLEAIAEELGNLPLALHLAGSFLKLYQSDMTPVAYLAELRAAMIEHESLQGEETTLSPTKHDLSVGRSFRLSYDKLDTTNVTDSLALDLLQRAAYFAPGEPISRDLLLKTVKLPDKTAERRATRAIKRLIDLGLLEIETEGALRLHRLVGAFVYAKRRGGAVQATVERVVIKLGFELLNNGIPAPLHAIQAHLRNITDKARERNDIQAADLCTTLGRYLQLIGSYAAARPYLEHALAFWEDSEEPNERRIATSLNNLGLLLQAQGDYATARPLFERALTIRERVLGPDEPSTAQSLNNLAGMFKDQGDYASARLLFERALAIRERLFGVDHPYTATSLNNLAGVLQNQGDYTSARSLFERALAISEQALGSDHPSTAANLNNLGLLLQAQGDYATARPLFERALAINEQALGSDHPSTAANLHNLARLLQNQGDYATARSLCERALAIRERVLGPDHPTTANGLINLAGILNDQGDYVSARSLCERALTISEQALEPDHPTIATCLNSLAGIIQNQGDYVNARLLLERSLAIRERVLGSDHPATAISLNSLGGVLRDQGDYASARSLLERALAIRERVLGSDHPATATSLNSLGRVLRDQGDCASARSLLERALAIREQKFGPDHPTTATSLNHLGEVLRDQDDYVSARSHLERSLAIREQQFGPDHPATATSLWSIAKLLERVGDRAGARILLERAAAIYTRALGAIHPTSQRYQHDLDALDASSPDEAS